MADLELDDDVRQRLVDASRLATLGRLLPSIIHQMSTPLGAVALRAESLGREGEGAGGHADLEKRQRYLKAMLDETRRCQDLLAVVRDFALPAELGATTFDIVLVLRAALRLLQNEAIRRQVVLQVEGIQAAAVNGQKQQLAHALLALLLNALDASPRGATVRAVVQTEDGWTSISVEDEGEDVPEGTRSRLFQPFASSAAPQRGLGLGLMSCRVIAEAHGGSVDREVGRSAPKRFVLRLPHARPQHGAP